MAWSAVANCAALQALEARTAPAEVLKSTRFGRSGSSPVVERGDAWRLTVMTLLHADCRIRSAVLGQRDHGAERFREAASVSPDICARAEVIGLPAEQRQLPVPQMRFSMSPRCLAGLRPPPDDSTIAREWPWCLQPAPQQQSATI